MTDEKIDCKGVISALNALTRNGELRDYDDELANRLEDAKEIVERYTALSSVGRLAGPIRRVERAPLVIEDDAPDNQRYAAQAENERLRAALIAAREAILSLRDTRWSEAEGTDDEWVGYIDAALSPPEKE